MKFQLTKEQLLRSRSSIVADGYTTTFLDDPTIKERIEKILNKRGASLSNPKEKTEIGLYSPEIGVSYASGICVKMYNENNGK